LSDVLRIKFFVFSYEAVFYFMTFNVA